MDSDESHFNVSLIVKDKVTGQRPQTTTFLKRKESRSGTEPRSFCLPLGQTGSHYCNDNSLLFIIIQTFTAAVSACLCTDLSCSDISLLFVYTETSSSTVAISTCCLGIDLSCIRYQLVCVQTSPVAITTCLSRNVASWSFDSKLRLAVCPHASPVALVRTRHTTASVV